MLHPSMEMTFRADEFVLHTSEFAFPISECHLVHARLHFVANRWQFIADKSRLAVAKRLVAVRDGISPNEMPFPAGEVAVHIGESAFRVTRWHFARRDGNSSEEAGISTQAVGTISPRPGFSSREGIIRSAETALHPRKATLSRISRDNLTGK